MSIGFLAGFVDAIAGGAGLITVPTLLAMGMPPHMTLGTNKFAATLGVFSSALTFVYRGFFKPWLWVAAIVATFAGALVGASATFIFSAQFLNYFLPIIIILVAVYMLLPRDYLTNAATGAFKPRKRSSMLLGILIGFYDGFLGPGTGSIWTSAIIAVYKLDLLTASAVARFMNFISSITALATFMVLKDVDYSVAILLSLTLILGSLVGANAAIYFGARFIKPIFLVVAIGIAIHLVYRLW
jgi:uncharacterized membrane protein YfcA